MLKYLMCWFVLLTISATSTYSQSAPPKTISMNEAVALALKNNSIAKNAELQVLAVRYQTSNSLIMAPTEINYANGQFYSSTNDSYFEVNQRFASPLTYIQKEKYKKQAIQLSETEQLVTGKKVTANTKIAYTTCVYRFAVLSQLKELNVLYDHILSITGVPYDSTDTNQLTRATAETHFASFQNKLFQAEQNCTLATNSLQLTLNSTENFIASDTTLELYAIEIMNSGNNKFAPTTHTALYTQTAELQKRNLQIQQSKLFPEVTAGYFNHEINSNKGFQGFKLGIIVPLWFFPQKAKIDEARINLAISKNESDYQLFTLTKTIENLKIQLDQLYVDISFYRENALKKADLLTQQVIQNIKTGNFNYIQVFESLESVMSIQLDYLEKVNHYNQTAIQLESLID